MKKYLGFTITFLLLMLVAALLMSAGSGAALAQDSPTSTPLPVLGPTPIPPTPDPPPNCPALQGESQDVRTSYYMGEGTAYLNTDQLFDAVFSFTCVIRVIDPNYVPAYMYRGRAYARQRDYERAIRDYTRATELSPALMPAFNNRGVIYTVIGEHDKAAADFDKVMQLDADYLPGYYNRSIVYGIKGDYDRAIDLLETAVEQSGIATILASYKDPDRDPQAEPAKFDQVVSESYALLGIMYSAKSLAEFNNYILLNNVNGYFADERIQGAASSLESRFTFEMRLDDGSWMYNATFTPLSGNDSE